MDVQEKEGMINKAGTMLPSPEREEEGKKEREENVGEEKLKKEMNTKKMK